MKIAKFLAAAMKAMKNPALLGSLEEFHKGLILHLQYLEARKADGVIDDFQDIFMIKIREYLDFLKSMGADLDIPQSREVAAPPPS